MTRLDLTVQVATDCNLCSGVVRQLVDEGTTMVPTISNGGFRKGLMGLMLGLAPQF